MASVTPIKGDTYADQVHALLTGIANGLGDEYVDTSANTGKLSRNRKGDGVLSIDGGAARVVFEMTDSARRGWTPYLDEAERNRDATAALGLVRTIDQNEGHTVRNLGPRRIVMAFDPERDDPSLLRTVVMVLRTASLAVSSRSGAHEIATAEEKVAAALTALTDIDEIKKVSEAISKNASKIDSRCSRITTTVNRLLNEALDALGGVDLRAAELQSQEGAA
ncbi:hypothetical protein [Phytoactinopolyspora alkaliphila]|uniref:hypothetical protein n=1 Tax=Phytoactinopolyspora alkaliphila TaxID=1783498 RepID=UPI001C20ADFD|nr:hypothetical protein [Phytoactinopolyspora alkaliphila]